MSSHHPFPGASMLPHRAAVPAYGAPAPLPRAAAPPPGTFAPGTKVTVGNHKVIIERYLSEGGFAHVYLVRVPTKPAGSSNSPDQAVLKRVAVPDKEALANMRTEVETMKKLKGHRFIVTYIDSHASQLKGGGYEVFLLMEYCDGGGLIDFMNTRLQHRLTEPEILNIFGDVAEGVACMHYLNPPLLHRDLKVENVLISTVGGRRLYKLCDFGSTAPPRPAATTAAEGRLIEDDVQRHTTLQYRSPEMIDVYRKQPIDEKSDIWALGVLLYKLCYYTTPFEEQGQMAILTATFKFPAYPQFSDGVKKLIASMLRENPMQRPNIYQVVLEVSIMRGLECPIKDIYANRTRSEARRNEKLPSPAPAAMSPPVIGLVQTTSPVQVQQQLPDIAPMRRGRPTAPAPTSHAAKPSPSPLRGTKADPFAALDSTNPTVRAAAADELAGRFPSLDEFSILHDKGTKFSFEPTSPPGDPVQESLNKRVTEVLADHAFVQPPQPPQPSQKVPPTKAQSAKVTPNISRTPSLSKTKSLETRPEASRSQAPAQIYQPTPTRPVNYVSTGTMTTPSPSPPKNPYPDISKRPIYRFPPRDGNAPERPSSQPKPSDAARAAATLLNPEKPMQRPALLDMHRSKSQTATVTLQAKSPASSRPSLEGSRPSMLDITEPISRARSAMSQPRPSSVYVESNLDYLRDRETSRGRSGLLPGSNASAVPGKPIEGPDSDSEPEPTTIESNVDFLKVMEGEGSSKRSRSNEGSHSKRASMPSLSLSSTKNMIAGKFSDAFKKFEGNSAHRSPSQSPERRAPALTPIEGSVATGGDLDDERVLEETEELSPEVRREMERRRLSQEEKRVAEAAAEYRRRLAAGVEGVKGKSAPPGAPGMTRASSIQNRVKSLLEDSSKATSPTKTASGYGKYTDVNQPSQQPQPAVDTNKPFPPVVARKPIGVAPNSSLDYNRTRPVQQPSVPLNPAAAPVPSVAATAAPTIPRPSSARPNAPPKPVKLRTGAGAPIQSDAPLSAAARPSLAQANDVLAPGGEDWEASFSKRYPSLSGLEMVETEIEPGRPPQQGREMRIKDL